MANLSVCEKNEQFIKFLTAKDYNKETLKQAVKLYRSFEGETVEDSVNKLITCYNKTNDSWDVKRVADEYDHLSSLTGKDLELWKKYRAGLSAEPIRKADGHYIETLVVGLHVIIDGVELSVDPNTDSLSFGANKSDGNGYHAVVNVAVLEKALKVKEELTSLLRYLE